MSVHKPTATKSALVFDSTDTKRQEIIQNQTSRKILFLVMQTTIGEKHIMLRERQRRALKY